MKKRKDITIRKPSKTVVSGSTKPSQEAEGPETMKLIPPKTPCTESWWASPPRQQQTSEEVEKLKVRVLDWIRERVFRTLQGIPNEERSREDNVADALYSTAQLNLLARSSGLLEAVEKLHNIKNQSPDTASTLKDARDRLEATAENFPTELSILKDFYKRIASEDDLQEIWAHVRVRLRNED